MATHNTAQELVEGWMRTQQKVWEDWLAMLRSGGSGAEMWTGTIEQWEGSVRKALEAENESVRAWAKSVESMEGAPDDVRKWAKEGVEVVDRWVGAQGQLWDQWFALVRKAAAATPPGGKAGDAFMRAWQDAAHQMLEAQGRWSKAFGAAAPTATAGTRAGKGKSGD